MKVMLAREAREPYDKDALESLIDSSVDEVVRQQADAGLSIVNDGELGRNSYADYIRERLTGFEMRPADEHLVTNFDQVKSGNLTPGTLRARAKFGEFMDLWRPVERSMFMPPELQGTPAAANRTEVPVCTGPISYTGLEALTRDLNRLKAAVSKVEVEGGFVTAASPSIACYHASNNEYYATEEEYLFAMADVLNVEYRAITSAGFDLQIDAPDLCHLYDPAFEDEYLRWLGMRIEAINRALDGVPEDKARLHICWGSGNHPHVNDVPLRLIIDEVFKVRTQGYSLEGANDRHAHEVLMWDDVKLPEGKVLFPGVVGHVSNIIEHPELVAWRITQYAERVGKENVVASTDCGYSQSWNNRRAHPQIQWAKLEALAEGAQLASQRLWPARELAANRA
jgi:5-methyltetrahydropteroyltriglutamate--homocysteine methyltransferase